MPVLVLVTSAFLHALWNALLKRERQPQVAVAGVLAVALLLATVAALVSAGPSFGTRAALGWAFGAGAFEGIYFPTLAAALVRADYGIVYTVARGGAMLLVWPLAALLLREPVTAAGVLGACLVGVGLALTTGHPARRSTSRSGLAYAAVCAASVAGYHLCYGRALSAGARPTPLFAVSMATALPLVLVSLRGRLTAPGVQLSAGSTLRWAVSGVLCTASFLLFLSGLEAAGAGVALTLRNTSIVFAQGLALALGERPTRLQVVGAFLVAAGAALFGVR
jgi:drug/metabolite transporter (DMT)-like permease